MNEVKLYSYYKDLKPGRISIEIRSEISGKRDQKIIKFIKEENIPHFPLNIEQFNKYYIKFSNFTLGNDLLVIMFVFDNSVITVNNGIKKTFESTHAAISDIYNLGENNSNITSMANIHIY
jgi:hypothetical protein